MVDSLIRSAAVIIFLSIRLTKQHDKKSSILTALPVLSNVSSHKPTPMMFNLSLSLMYSILRKLNPM